MPLNQPTPVPPEDLPPVARAVLQALGVAEGARAAVGASLAIGGGVGLQHYINQRPTVDLDLWWTREPSSSDRRALEAAVASVAEEHNYVLRHHSHGDVTSLAFVRKNSADDLAEFTVEVAMRDVQLAPYAQSAWTPVLLESLEDNVASKMVALVSRGSWRDFADIYAVVSNGLITIDNCWTLWARKQDGLNRVPDVVSGKASVLRHLARIKQFRPIENIQDPTERARATELRRWFEAEFAAAGKVDVTTAVHGR